MKPTHVLFAIIFLAVSALVITSAVTPASALAAGETPDVQDAQNDETPPPTGVSAENPGTDPPGWDSRCYRRHKRGGRFSKRPGERIDQRSMCGMRTPRGGRHGGQHGRMEGRQRAVPAERFLKHAAQLDLTDDQVSKLEKLAYDTKTQLIDLRAEMAKARVELQRLRRSNSEDVAQFKKHFNAMATLRVEIQEARLINRIEAKKILTDEQKQMLEQKQPRRGMIRG